MGGRGVGKSSAVAWIFREMMQALPGGRIYYASTTLEQIKLEMMPEIKKKLADFGLVEGIHYVDCKTPPEWFEPSIAPPEDTENCLTFYNGFYVHFKSTLRWRSKKGGSYDGAILDEAAETNGGIYKKIFIPSVRGNRYKFKSHWHHVKIVLTNRPNPEFPPGYWVYEFKKLHETNPDEVLYMESSAEDNKDVLGQEWFDDMLLTLGEEAYEVTVLNKEQRKIPTGFYHNLDRDRHCYQLKPGEVDVRPLDVLEVSFDFGGKFNCCSVWQEHNQVERCTRQFFVKREGKVSTLVDKFCAFHRHHPMKYVRIWGDPRGHDSDPDRPSLYDGIIKRFQYNGWGCEVRVQPGKRTTSHKARYLFMEQILGGANPILPTPQFNEEACPNIIRSMELCDVQDDYQKIKTAEKDPSYPQEDAPHFSDTVDYYLYEKHAWRLLAGANDRAGGIW